MNPLERNRERLVVNLESIAPKTSGCRSVQPTLQAKLSSPFVRPAHRDLVLAALEASKAVCRRDVKIMGVATFLKKMQSNQRLVFGFRPANSLVSLAITRPLLQAPCAA